MTKNTRGICTIDGCTREVNRRNMCSRHYRKALLENKPKCSVEHCQHPQRAKDLCNKHHQKLLKYGDPLLGKDYNQAGRVRYNTPQEAFNNRTEWIDDCLIWNGPKDRKGYGRLTILGKKIPVHRYAWEQANGDIPEGMQIDHTCWNSSCANIEHLRLATRYENARNLSGAPVTNKSSGIRNVHRHNSKWRVVVEKEGKRYRYGSYSTIEEAAEVAEQARKELFGEFAGRG